MGGGAGSELNISCYEGMAGGSNSAPAWCSVDYNSPLLAASPAHCPLSNGGKRGNFLFPGLDLHFQFLKIGERHFRDFHFRPFLRWIITNSSICVPSNFLRREVKLVFSHSIPTRWKHPFGVESSAHRFGLERKIQNLDCILWWKDRRGMETSR